MTREKRIEECCKYFKENPGFSRILVKIGDRYKVLGKIGGTIRLDRLTMEEKEALTGFLKKSYYKDSTTINLERFERALDNTPFEGITLVEILEGYFGKDILTNKEKKEIYIDEQERFFAEILKDIDGLGHEWLMDILLNKENGYRLIMQYYNKDKEELKRDLHTVSRALNNLPFLKKEFERLAIFASKTIKDPHAFDENTSGGRLLLNGIVHILDASYPKNVEERTELLYKAGIISDEISNFTICSGLQAYKNGEIHCGWKGFYELGEPLHISIWNLSKIDKIISTGRVYIFENPTVFSEILHRTSACNISMVCTYGQVKLASLILLDKLVEGGAELYYSGDFDPEGLIIGDKLKSRYKDNLILWRYTKEDYMKSISKNKIDESRIKKLNRLESKELIAIGETISEYGYAAYQESILDELEYDVKKGCFHE